MIGTYEVFTRVDGKSDSDEILSILAEISSGRRKNDLKLVNYYQCGQARSHNLAGATPAPEGRPVTG
jgi:S-ribosylhomocysteine lyase LuxS involved in autoinducer biosynthesis